MILLHRIRTGLAGHCTALHSAASRHPLQPLRRAPEKENGSADVGLHPASKYERNGHDESLSPGSISSSPGSASLLASQLPTADGMARPSTAASTGSASTGPYLDSLPPRKSSLAPATERAHTSLARESMEFKTLPSPSVPPELPTTPAQTMSTSAPVPPPRSPARQRTHRTNISTGNIFSEPEPYPHGRVAFHRSRRAVWGVSSAEYTTARVAGVRYRRQQQYGELNELQFQANGPKTEPHRSHAGLWQAGQGQGQGQGARKIASITKAGCCQDACDSIISPIIPTIIIISDR